MIDRQRKLRLFHASKAAERDHSACGRMNVDFLKITWIISKVGFHLKYQPVLVQLREHDRYLALSECIVERVVDHLRSDSQS